MHTTYWLIWRGLHRHVGLLKNNLYKQARREWLRQHKTQLDCALCGEKIDWGKVTVDHIIPRKILYEYGLIELIFDSRNFQAAHELCNAKRGDLTIDDLPPAIRYKILDLTSQQKAMVS